MFRQSSEVVYIEDNLSESSVPLILLSNLICIFSLCDSHANCKQRFVVRQINSPNNLIETSIGIFECNIATCLFSRYTGISRMDASLGLDLDTNSKNVYLICGTQ